MNIIENKLNELNKSNFRSNFHLKDKDIEYIDKIGIVKIKEHAYDFIKNRLNDLEHDGKQTPMNGHPVFIAQHATATCCRGCLEKWHHIKNNHELTDREINYIVNIILYWIKNDYKRHK